MAEIKMKTKFHKRFRELRESLKMSRLEMADMFDVGEAAIVQWETRRREPGLGKALRIAKKFGVSVDWLLARTDKKEVNV